MIDLYDILATVGLDLLTKDVLIDDNTVSLQVLACEWPFDGRLTMATSNQRLFYPKFSGSRIEFCTDFDQIWSTAQEAASIELT